MAYSFQTFSVLEVLTAAKMNQGEVNIRDHAHGAAGVLATGHTFTSPTIQGTVGAGTGLTMPAFVLSGNITQSGNPSINIGTGALTAGATSVTTLTASGLATFLSGSDVTKEVAPDAVAIVGPNRAIGSQDAPITIYSNSAMGADVGGMLAFGGLDFAGTTALTYAAIKGAKETATDHTGGALIFGTRPDGGSITERMRIASNGTVTLGVGSVSPLTSDGAALGTTSLMWSDLFLANGAVINWNNGEVTLTHSTSTLTFGAATAVKVIVPSLFYVNNSTNANMTNGITINQGAADDEILSLKSSDVAHGITIFTETNTYGLAKKVGATTGGLAFYGWSSGTGGLQLYGSHTTDNTTKSTAGSGAIDLLAALKSGTSITNCGADANLVTIRNNTTTRFIFDAEGSAHADVEWITFDHHDDVVLLNGLDAEMQYRKGVVQRDFGEWVSQSRDVLQREGIFNFYDDGPRAMMNMTRMHMLEVGAIRQLARQGADVELRLAALERRLLQ